MRQAPIHLSMTLSLLFLLCPIHVLGAEPFHFIAHGDTAYGEASYPIYESLIKDINASRPAFTIHVGDTKGHQPCDSDSLARIQSFFEKFEHPVFYTPGDNEWTDCQALKPSQPFQAPMTAAEVKLKSLADIRQTFFNKPLSLGKNPISVTRQSDQSKYPFMVENIYWEHQSILFATLHVVGSNDGFGSGITALEQEAELRAKANLAWLHLLEKKMQKKPPRAMVISLHAELFEPGKPNKKEKKYATRKIRGGAKGPYFPIVKSISALSQSYPNPILVIHGDHHTFTLDKPFAPRNITRLQVYGEPLMKAVKIYVDQKSETVFKIETLASDDTAMSK